MPFETATPLYVGSRPLALGNAFTAIVDEAEAGFWNPAGLIQWQGVKVFGSTQVGNRQEYAFDSKCVAYSYRDYGFFWGNKIVTRGAEGETPDFTYYSLARKLSSHLAVGGSIKFKRKHPCGYYQFFGYAPGYDVGFLWKGGSEVSAGALIQNMGDSDHWVSRITLGVAHILFKRTLISADAVMAFHADSMFRLHLGLERHLSKWMTARLGVSDGDPTAGLGFRFRNVNLDYAWVRNKKGNAHFISGQVKL